MNNMLKPGILTTEMWITLASHAIGFAVLFGWVKSSDAKSLEDAVKQTVVALSVVVGNLILAYKYVHDRGGLKKMVLGNGNGNGNTSGPSVPPLNLGGKS